MRLAALTTLRLGGPAERLVEAQTEAELVEAVRAEPALVLAGGSNVVIADDGVPGTVVARPHARGRSVEGDLLVVQAGEPWDEVVARCVAEGLQGFECLSGIPGSTGATPIQNVGAYGQDVSQTVAWVRVYDAETDRVETLDAAACGFDYRRSVFKYRDRWTVLAVAFRMTRVRAVGAAALRRARAHARRAGRRPGAAARRPRGRARPAAWQGHGDRSRRSRLRQRRLVLHEPDPRPRGVDRTSRCAPAFPEPDGRIKTSAAG